METKDLVLLMMLPILLISLVVYTDRNPTITAAVTAQQEQSNVIGTYSIMPSFKAKIENINHDLNDYKIIKQSLDFITKCSESGTVENCVNQLQTVDNVFEWSLGCDKGAEKVLYDFAEFLQNCIDSDETNCICTKKLNVARDKLIEYGLSTKGYSLSLTKNKDSKKIEVRTIEPNTNLYYNIKVDTLPEWSSSIYKLNYNIDGSTRINLFFLDDEDVRSGLGPIDELILYKRINDDNTVSVDFVKRVYDTFMYPDASIIKPENLHDCDIKPKNTVKFCVTKKNSKVMAYDKSDGQVKERPVTIRFASYVPNPPPSPLKNIEVYDRPKAEKFVLVKWGKSIDKDVAKYRIYYTTTFGILDKTPTKDLRKNGVNKIELNARSFEPINFDDVGKCEFDYQEKKCYFSTIGGGKVPIENNKLYYSSAEGGIYIYGVDVEDNKDYDFTVTAVDKNNNEIDNIDPKQKLSIVKSVKSIDDLPPDSKYIAASPNYDASTKEFRFDIIKSTTKNIDNSEIKDFKEFRVYYKKYQTKDEYKNAKDQINGLLLKDLKIANILEQTTSYIKVSLPEDIQANNIFQFVIIATDKSDNPIDSQYKVMDIGAKPLDIEIQESGATLLQSQPEIVENPYTPAP